MWQKKTFFYFLFLLFSCKVNAGEEVAKALVTLLDHKTYQAHFIQKIRDSNSGQTFTTQGQVAIQRPNKFYWKTQKPEPILIVADGEFLWTYDISLAQVIKQGLQEALRYSPAALLSGNVSSLPAEFVITKESEEAFLLRPRKEESPFSTMVIRFRSGKLTEIKMQDPFGQEVSTLFSNVKVDNSIDNELFHFTPPKGVDVLEGGKV